MCLYNLSINQSGEKFLEKKSGIISLCGCQIKGNQLNFVLVHLYPVQSIISCILDQKRSYCLFQNHFVLISLLCILELTTFRIIWSSKEKKYMYNYFLQVLICITGTNSKKIQNTISSGCKLIILYLFFSSAFLPPSEFGVMYWTCLVACPNYIPLLLYRKKVK